MNFRNNHVQNIFKLAAQSKYIHILATIDHIHASLSQLWFIYLTLIVRFRSLSLESTKFNEFPVDLVRRSHVVS